MDTKDLARTAIEMIRELATADAARREFIARRADEVLAKLSPPWVCKDCGADFELGRCPRVHA